MIVGPKRGEKIIIKDAPSERFLRFLEALSRKTDILDLINVEEGADVTNAVSIAAAGGLLDGDYTSNGIQVRVSSGSYTIRSIAGTSGEVNVVNGDGVSGDPAISLDPAITNPEIHFEHSENSPTTALDKTLFKTKAAMTIQSIECVVRGTVPSVTFTLRHSTDRSAAGNEVVTGGTTVTNETTGVSVTVFNDATIPADSFVWLEASAVSGTVDELHLTTFYKND